MYGTNYNIRSKKLRERPLDFLDLGGRVFKIILFLIFGQKIVNLYLKIFEQRQPVITQAMSYFEIQNFKKKSITIGINIYAKMMYVHYYTSHFTPLNQ